MVGFEFKHVKSDESICRHFECVICQNLVAVDCLLTVPCHHCFCRTCLTEWTTSSAGRNDPSCPTCRTSLKSNKGSGLVLSGGTRLLVQPILQNSMACRILKSIQVECPTTCDAFDSCTWCGEYGDVQKHLFDPEQHPSMSQFSTSETTATRTLKKRRVVIRGCGSEFINGVYKQDGRKDGYNVYTKVGNCNGENHRIEIAVSHSTSGNRRWYISIPSENKNFYAAKIIEGKNPPSTGWSRYKKGPGELPVPKIKLMR